MIRPPDSQLLRYLAACDPHVARLALATRQVVLEEAPEALETIFSGYAISIAFSFTGKPIKDGFCHVVVYTNHVNLGFNRGALLPDPNKVLKGTGKLIRHFLIESEGDLDRPFIRHYLQAAIEQVGGRPESSAVERSTADRSSAKSKKS